MYYIPISHHLMYEAKNNGLPIDKFNDLMKSRIASSAQSEIINKAVKGFNTYLKQKCNCVEIDGHIYFENHNDAIIAVTNYVKHTSEFNWRVGEINDREYVIDLILTLELHLHVPIIRVDPFCSKYLKELINGKDDRVAVYANLPPDAILSINNGL